MAKKYCLALGTHFIKSHGNRNTLVAYSVNRALQLHLLCHRNCPVEHIYIINKKKETDLYLTLLVSLKNKANITDGSLKVQYLLLKALEKVESNLHHTLKNEDILSHR